jgi:hypothetical protein
MLIGWSKSGNKGVKLFWELAEAISWSLCCLQKLPEVIKLSENNGRKL